MECLENICYCVDGFYPHNEHCLESKYSPSTKLINGNNQKRYTFNPCNSKPCLYGSFCENLFNAKFICHCSLGKYGSLCENNYTAAIFPSFKSYSYIELTPIEFNLNDFSIELEFKATSLDGIILSAYKSSIGYNDFITICLKNGKIELGIYESGLGYKSSRMNNSIKIGKFHRLFVKKKRNFLFMQLDDQYPYREQTSFLYRSNEKKLFLGDFRNEFSIKIKEKLNVTEGFKGCVQYLKIKNKIINISFPSPDIKNGINIEECTNNECLTKLCKNNGRCRLKTTFSNKIKSECVCKNGYKENACEEKINPCLSSPCKHSNESQCIPTSISSFQCVCSENFDGELCERNVNIKSPFIATFEGKSYIERPPIGADIFLIDIIFYSNKKDGILFYNRGFNLDHFIGAKIENSFFHLIISINGKFESIISRNPLEANRWNKIRLVKENSKFKVYVNFDKFVLSTYEYQANSLNLSDSLFIGGIKNTGIISQKFKIIKGLNGAIQKAIFNNEIQNDVRKNAIELGGVYRYEGFPCNVTCLNGGVCIPGFNKFKCNCPNGFSGKFCQKINGRKTRNYNEAPEKRNQTGIYLDGHSELFFKNRIYDIMKVQYMNKFEIAFKTKCQNGLLLYTGNGNLNSFLYIAIFNGKLVYSFSLPNQKQKFSISTKTKLNDNYWHFVTIERNRRKAILNVDNNIKLNATFDEVNYVGYGNLATDGYIRIGGYRKLPTGMPQYLNAGFQGCIKDFFIDDRSIDLFENNLNKKLFPNKCSNENENQTKKKPF